jgi:hypothetical protein
MLPGRLGVHCWNICWQSLFLVLTLLKLHLPNSWFASLLRRSFFLFWADPPCIWPTTLVPHSYSISWIEAAMLYGLLTSNFYFEVMTITTISPRIYRVINFGCHSCQGTWVVTNHFLVAWYVLPAKHPLFLSWLGLGCRTIHTLELGMSPCPTLARVQNSYTCLTT